MKKMFFSIWISIFCVMMGFLLWTQFYYIADPDSVSKIMSNWGLQITENNTTITLMPVNKSANYTFIFYPWAKVDAHAYIEKLWKIALDNNIKIVISKPPLHLQIFSINAAENISWENIIIWWHSLGWSMACEYVANHPAHISGIILFWSYCNSDISSLWIKTLIIAASHDGLLSPDKIASYSHNLPKGNTFFILNWSVHAQFWNYGPQKGDGISTLSDEEVLSQMSEEIGVFLADLNDRSLLLK